MNRLLIVGVATIGFGSLIVSLRGSWFDGPIGFTTANGSSQVIKAEPWSTPCYKVATSCMAGYALAAWAAKGIWRRTLPLALATWMAMLLMFPWTVMVLDDQVAPQAAWLQTQHENLTWLGGDLSTSQEQAALNWKNRLYVVDAPTTVSLAAPPQWLPWQLGLERLPQLFDWLGYTNTFCQFARRSWMLALFGTACLLATSCFDRDTFVVARMRCALLCAAVVAFLGGLVASGLQFAGGHCIGRAAECTRHGSYLEASRHLEHAAWFLPALRFDTDYLTQRGLLDHLAGSDTRAAIILRAHLLEREGRYAEAEQIYESLLASHAPGSGTSPVQRAALLGYFRSAVHALNCGDDEQAIRQLEQILKFDPCNLKANYMLQLAYLRLGEHDAMVHLVAQLYATYGCFKFPNKRVVLAAGQQNMAYGAFQEGDLLRAWQHSSKAKQP